MKYRLLSLSVAVFVLSTFSWGADRRNDGR